MGSRMGTFGLTSTVYSRPPQGSMAWGSGKQQEGAGGQLWGRETAKIQQVQQTAVGRLQLRDPLWLHPARRRSALPLRPSTRRQEVASRVAAEPANLHHRPAPHAPRDGVQQQRFVVLCAKRPGVAKEGGCEAEEGLRIGAAPTSSGRVTARSTHHPSSLPPAPPPAFPPPPHLHGTQHPLICRLGEVRQIILCGAVATAGGLRDGDRLGAGRRRGANRHRQPARRCKPPGAAPARHRDGREQADGEDVVQLHAQQTPRLARRLASVAAEAEAGLAGVGVGEQARAGAQSSQRLFPGPWAGCQAS